ncbi:MAG: hypothetical protein JRJ60_20550, partial [Deltaproteobacteria bacterium]|nr:hypothetical protein [Deltaproteobacteria bacterium]
SISGKNALTGGIGSSNVGGHFAPELKYAGFDGFIVEGRSPSPVYLLIRDKQAALYGADHLSGMSTWDTEDALRATYGKTARVLSIGPAGEIMALVACIIVDKARAAGRCGFAAIMGSKNLKAVVVQGSLPVLVARPDEFQSSVNRARTQIMATKTIDRLRSQGTCGSAPRANTACTIPVRNFQDDHIEKAFNTLHGNFGVEDDYPPQRFFEEPVKSGPCKGSLFDREKWKGMLEEYYALHGWDPETGLQTRRVLRELGLSSVLGKLEEAGRLPAEH